MNIQITGESPAARTLETYLSSLGYSPASLGYSLGGSGLRISIEAGAPGVISLEGLRGKLADEALHSIAELTQTPVQWRKSMTAGESELLIRANQVDHDPVARGVLRALLKITGHGSPGASRPGWCRLLRLK
jgi:hypothetical protein